MDEGTVQHAVTEILQTSDLNAITLRQVMQQVEDKLGSPVKPYKAVVKRTVDDFLGLADAGNTPNKKAKKTATPTKAPSQAAAHDNDALPSDGCVELSDKRSAILSTYKGKTRLDVREFYVDSETGERKHSSKGLAMPLEQVDTLLAAASDIQAAVEKGEELSVNLSSNGLRRVTVSRFKSSTLVSLREYYTDASGEAKPGKRGISLSLQQWSVLKENLPALAAALRSAGG